MTPLKMLLQWSEITNNLLELFLEPAFSTGEFAIQRFYKAYNAKTSDKTDLKTFAQECVGSYVATLQGLYLNYILQEIRNNDGNRIVNTPKAQLLIDYYGELIKKLFAKTRADVRQQIGEEIDKKINMQNRKTELRNIFDSKKISQVEKDVIINTVDKYRLEPDSILAKMVEDIKDFCSADVSYLDRYFLLKMLEKNYADDPDCREHKLAFAEVVEGISNNSQLARALEDIYSEDSGLGTNSNVSSKDFTPRPASPVTDAIMPQSNDTNTISSLRW